MKRDALRMSLSVLTAFAALLLPADTTSLVDRRPADGIWPSRWYPLGNGSLGCMLGGGERLTRCQFNVDSFWSGAAEPSVGVDDESSDRNLATLGYYLAFGNLDVELLVNGETAGFRRRLDFPTALYTDEAMVGGVRLTRRAVASQPDGLVAIEFATDRPVSYLVRLQGTHDEYTCFADNDQRTLAFSGVLPNKLGYAARCDLRPDAGEVRHIANASALVEKTTRLLVFLRAGTTYDPSRADFGLTGGEVTFAKTLPASFDAAFSRHLAEYAPYWQSMRLELGGAADGVERLFNYGRYLLIASSRPGTLPANLQGVWNDTNRPEWHCDYHTNINLQMNYWGADSAGLGACFEPLTDYLASVVRMAEKETRLSFPGSKGFALRTSANLYGRGGWRWNFAGAPWLAAQLYDHYLFTQDREWLEKRAWPFIRGATEFAEGHLKALPDGSLVVANGWSPEHGPREDGVAHDQQIFRELFLSVIGAQKVLKSDPAFAARIAEKLARLAPDRIGKWGQLQEWREDRDVRGDDHPHTSHLFAVYPGTTIGLDTTPELARAARVALDGRAITGYCRRSWTWAWRTGLYARLGDGEKAALMLDQFLEHNVLDNLFADHPPFQIDGNLGILGTIPEMLVQSHEVGADGRRIIRLLPALPKAWRNGSVTGLRCRGGLTVDLSWRDGKVASKTIRGGDPSAYAVR